MKFFPFNLRCASKSRSKPKFKEVILQIATRLSQKEKTQPKAHRAWQSKPLQEIYALLFDEKFMNL